MSGSDARSKPKAGAGDVAHTIMKAGLLAIPTVGGPAAEILSAIVVPPLTRRRDEWIESIATGLKAVEEKMEGFKIENLSGNEMFITTVMQASQVAIRNHQKEKLEALRNAVLNATLPNAPEEDMQVMFLNFVDTLTSWHLRILKFLDDPKGSERMRYKDYASSSIGSLATVLGQAFPELGGRREFYDWIAKDLYTRGLINTESLHTTTNIQSALASHTTTMGKQFIKFVTSPIENAGQKQ